MALSSRPKRDCSEWLAGIRVGLTYSPLFWLTLNASVLMPLSKHAPGHGNQVRGNGICSFWAPGVTESAFTGERTVNLGLKSLMRCVAAFGRMVSPQCVLVSADLRTVHTVAVTVKIKNGINLRRVLKLKVRCDGWLAMADSSKYFSSGFIEFKKHLILQGEYTPKII